MAIAPLLKWNSRAAVAGGHYNNRPFPKYRSLCVNLVCEWEAAALGDRAYCTNGRYYDYCYCFYFQTAQQLQKSPPSRNSGKMASAGTGASTSWSKYKRGSAVGTVTSASQTGVTSPTVIVIEEFDADVFRQLVEYVHTGCVILQPRTLLGKWGAMSNIN